MFSLSGISDNGTVIYLIKLNKEKLWGSGTDSLWWIFCSSLYGDHGWSLLVAIWVIHCTLREGRLEASLQQWVSHPYLCQDCWGLWPTAGSMQKGYLECAILWVHCYCSVWGALFMFCLRCTVRVLFEVHCYYSGWGGTVIVLDLVLVWCGWGAL